MNPWFKRSLGRSVADRGGLAAGPRSSEVAQGIGALGTVLAIYFLVKQTAALTVQTTAVRRAEERNLRLTRATGYATLGQLMLGLDSLYAVHADLRAYAYGESGLPQEGTVEYSRAILAAETIVDLLDVYSQQSELLGRSGDESWEALACDVYRESEVVRHYWASRADWYPDELSRVFAKARAGMADDG